ncbi:ATP-binding protein, partial [Clostridioides difficile]|uniref:ATP-binding protein n=1 Tax=Clostridioides difficile TaxID=1496 RepID=UPI002F2E3234
KSRNLERRGIGRGLEICKSIVEAHGGEIVAFNNPSGGATFRFSIPMYDEEGKDKWK